VRPRVEELDWRQTPMGAISLRRRVDPVLHVDVYEVKLGDEFLMSSLFTVAEVELARLALATVSPVGLDIVVGGLGLGFTARVVLEDARVRAVLVVDALEPVIDWHRQGLLPFATTLTSDPRCRLVHGDFFAMTRHDGYDPEAPGRTFDGILLDVDHSPRHLLHPSHAAFYTPDGLRTMAGHLRPGGVFALWSNDPPDEPFLADLREVFVRAHARVVTFANPIRGGESTNTVYVANTALADSD
jgi:spermidine synthase